MNAYVSKEELAFLPANRVSHPEHHADARSQRSKGGLFARLRAWVERRSVLAELHAMSERELADIGLSRNELGRVFNPAAAGRTR